MTTFENILNLKGLQQALFAAIAAANSQIPAGLKLAGADATAAQPLLHRQAELQRATDMLNEAAKIHWVEARQLALGDKLTEAATPYDKSNRLYREAHAIVYPAAPKSDTLPVTDPKSAPTPPTVPASTLFKGAGTNGASGEPKTELQLILDKLGEIEMGIIPVAHARLLSNMTDAELGAALQGGASITPALLATIQTIANGLPVGTTGSSGLRPELAQVLNEYSREDLRLMLDQIARITKFRGRLQRPFSKAPKAAPAATTTPASK